MPEGPSPVPLSRRRVLALGGAAAASLALPPLRAQSPDLTALSIAQAFDRLRRGQVSPVELTEACLARIARHNPDLNAFITLRADAALDEARTAAGEIRRSGPRSPLHGVPIALKDNIDTAGLRTTGASRLFADRVPAKDAEVARRLKEAGAILLGKLNLHEFAYGGTSTVTAFGTMHNPWNPAHATGGSSGGPGAAVAAGLCFGALGTDTAGSVRIPAAHCGVVGLKPTYGRVSTRGVMTLSWTLDHVGPLCRTVEDVALMLGVVAGYDRLDPTTADVPVPDYRQALGAPTAAFRLGVVRSPFFDGLDPEVAAAVDAALGVLRGLTAGTMDVTLPMTGPPAELWGPEARAYHARWIEQSPELYQPSTRRSLEQWADADAAAYAQAVHDVQLVRRQIAGRFTDVDLLVSPTMKTPAPPLDGTAPGDYNSTHVFDVLGLPTISVPCGFSRAGLPIGLQIAGAPWAESAVLTLAHAYEQATAWHTRRPPLD